MGERGFGRYFSFRSNPCSIHFPLKSQTLRRPSDSNLSLVNSCIWFGKKRLDSNLLFMLSHLYFQDSDEIAILVTVTKCLLCIGPCSPSFTWIF